MTASPNRSARNSVLVGIIIPAFNSAKTLPRTLETVKALKNRIGTIRFYCVLVDDCSKDDTSNIVKQYIETGVVDQYHQNLVNQGVSASRNIGIALCKDTDFITFCDADDEFSTAHFDLFACIDSDFIFFDHQLKEGEHSRLIHHHDGFLANQSIDNQRLADYLAHYLQRPNAFHLFTSCWSKLFRTRIIHENNIRFDPQMKVFEDIKFNFEFLLHARQKYYLPQLLYIHYRPLLNDFKQSASMGGHCSVVESFSFFKALEPLKPIYAALTSRDIQKEIYHCIAAYSVITLVRSSMKICSWRTFWLVRSQIISLFRSETFKNAFVYYDPVLARGNCVLPIFIKHQLFTLGLIYAYSLGVKRYSIRNK